MKVGPVKVHHLSDRPKSIEGPNREGGWRAARALDPLRVVGALPHHWLYALVSRGAGRARGAELQAAANRFDYRSTRSTKRRL